MEKKGTYRSNIVNISLNKHFYYEYFIENEIEAGIVLKGWEVKSLRARKVNISNSYVIFKEGEAFLFGANFTPLQTDTTHCFFDSTRIRKLLLNKNELNSLYGHIKRKGYTIIALSLYWKGDWCKISIGIAKGKKQYDKRINLKEREWEIYKSRIMKHH